MLWWGCFRRQFQEIEGYSKWCLWHRFGANAFERVTSIMRHSAAFEVELFRLGRMNRRFDRASQESRTGHYFWILVPFSFLRLNSNHCNLLRYASPVIIPIALHWIYDSRPSTSSWSMNCFSKKSYRRDSPIHPSKEILKGSASQASLLSIRNSEFCSCCCSYFFDGSKINSWNQYYKIE